MPQPTHESITADCHFGEIYSDKWVKFIADNIQGFPSTTTGVNFEFSNGTTTTTKWCAPTSCDRSVELTTPGTYTYTFSYQGEKICSASFVYEGSSSSSSSSAQNITANCSFSGNVAAGGTAKLEISTLSGQETDNVTMHLEGEGVSKDVTVNKYYNGGFTFTAPSTVGSYIYTLTYEGKTICSATLKTVDLLECSVSPSTIMLGESFTLNTEYAGSCWGATLKENGTTTAWNCTASKTITPTAAGTYTVQYDIGNGSVGAASCTVNVEVKEKSKTVTSVSEYKDENVSATVSKNEEVRLSAGACVSYNKTTRQTLRISCKDSNYPKFSYKCQGNEFSKTQLPCNKTGSNWETWGENNINTKCKVYLWSDKDVTVKFN